VDAMEGVLEASSENDGKFFPMTGDNGIQFKMFAIHAFPHDSNQINPNNFIEGESLSSVLPNLWIMPATKAANCGTSSRFCCHLYWNGMAPSYYSLVQEIGHDDWIPIDNHPGGSNNRYEMHLSFPCLVKLYVRILQHSDHSECNVQYQLMMEVLKLVVLSTTCQHALMESYFKNPDSTIPNICCLTKCAFCRNHYQHIIEQIHRETLSRLLIIFCSIGAKNRATNNLVKFFSTNKSLIYHVSNVASPMGPIHGLCLQLVATGIIDLGIPNETKNKIGKLDLIPANVIIKLGSRDGQPTALNPSS
jgi:hypothetical protein